MKESDNATKSIAQSKYSCSVYCLRRLARKSGIKPKDMIGIPWMLAFALRERGWYLREVTMVDAGI